MSTISVIVRAAAAQGLSSRSLRLEALDDPLPAFSAGAHIDLHLPNGLVRQYSLANAPHQADHYLLCIKHEAASRGGSAFVHQVLQPGTRLQVSTPRNRFPLREAGHHVLVAAGIGITPLLAMAETLQAGGKPFSLHYYSRNPDEVVFAERFARGFGGNPVYLHYSSKGASPRTHTPPALAQPRPGARLYLCGPAAFMATMQARALQAGWPAEHIHSEAFAARTGAASGGAFRVRLARSGKSVEVSERQSIAGALLDAGVEVPLSCEMGICGACLTGVLEGEVDHRDQVLSEQEQQAGGQIALCCSRSHSAVLVLDL